MFTNTKALVLREVRYKEADRILTLLTDTDGKVTANARGALRRGSRIAAATQQLTFSEMTLFGNRDKYTVNEASVVEPFTLLRTDMPNYALGCYFAECAEAMAVEDQPDAPLLQLTLNSLYALSNSLCPPEKIKAVFELRLMCVEGYEPDFSACTVCGAEEPEEPLLCLENGCVCCRKCKKPSMGETVRLTAEALKAMSYVVTAPAKQIFSFTIDSEGQESMSRACEEYFLRHSARSYGTLDYWKKINIK